MHDHVVVGLFEVAREHLWAYRISMPLHLVRGSLTVSPRIKVDHAPYAHVYDTEKALVLLLELLLVKYLYRQHAVLGHPPTQHVSIVPAIPSAGRA